LTMTCDFVFHIVAETDFKSFFSNNEGLLSFPKTCFKSNTDLVILLHNSMHGSYGFCLKIENAFLLHCFCTVRVEVADMQCLPRLLQSSIRQTPFLASHLSTSSALQAKVLSSVTVPRPAYSFLLVKVLD